MSYGNNWCIIFQIFQSRNVRLKWLFNMIYWKIIWEVLLSGYRQYSRLQLYSGLIIHAAEHHVSSAPFTAVPDRNNPTDICPTRFNFSSVQLHSKCHFIMSQNNLQNSRTWSQIVKSPEDGTERQTDYRVPHLVLLLWMLASGASRCSLPASHVRSAAPRSCCHRCLRRSAPGQQAALLAHKPASGGPRRGHRRSTKHPRGQPGKHKSLRLDTIIYFAERLW